MAVKGKIERAPQKLAGRLDFGGRAIDMGQRTLDVGGGRSLDMGRKLVGELKKTPADAGPAKSHEEKHRDTVETIRTEFMKRSDADKARFEAATDSEFWVAVCFQSRAQKEAFIDAVNWPGVDRDTRYVDGVRLAKALDLPIQAETFRPPAEKPNQSMVDLGIIGEDE